MSYQSEKRKTERQWKIWKLVLLTVALIALIGLCIFSAFIPPATWKYHVAKPSVSKRKEGELRIHFLDIGQGDCTLIELPDGKTMLIDGGDGRSETEKTILRYLNALDIGTLDYMVATHTDGDHCGGLAEIVRNKKIIAAYLPPVKETSNTEYAALYAELLKENCTVEIATRKTQLSVLEGSYPYTLSFLYPLIDSAEEENLAKYGDNTHSSVLWLDYKGASALFMGDAPFETENRLLFDSQMEVLSVYGVDLASTELLKIAHHGSKYSTSLEFLQYMNVEKAFISCGENNLYGHPTDEVLQRLKTVNAEIYRTDLSGTVMVTISENGDLSVS